MTQPQSYWRFAHNNRRLITFGFLMTFGSSFGQSFFIGVFQMPLREQLDLSASAFGGALSIATLVSAFVLPWSGKIIDHIPLQRFTLVVIAVFGIGCLLLANAQTFLLLTLSLFLLRHTGQGLLTHTASTTMARYFSQNRGKALSLSSTGMSMGEAVLPIVAVITMEAFGWRTAWTLFALSVYLLLLPAALWLLRTKPVAEEPLATHAPGPGGVPLTRHWTRMEVLKDVRFYTLLPALTAPGFILTGLFVHQGFIAQSKGWAMETIAIGFMVFALVKIFASLSFGTLADKFGIRWLLVLNLALLGAALMVLITFNAELAVFLYFALASIGVGGSMVVGGMLWPELYGTEHLGAIRSLSASIMVFSSALAPVAFGWLIDARYSIEGIAALCGVYVLIALGAVGLFLVSEKRQLIAAATAES